MARRKHPPQPQSHVAPLSIDELEAGLRLMNEAPRHRVAVWESNLTAFRQTVLVAIRDTSNALLSPTISGTWQAYLGTQLRELYELLDYADRHIAVRNRPLAPWLN